MGTRSLTRVFDENDVLVCMYRQFDGYPSGHGAELGEFLNGIVVVNGISGNEKRKIANGPGCLAAQLVAHFKDEPGGIYLYPANTKDAWQEYEYEVRCEVGKDINIKVFEVTRNKPLRRKRIFSGSPSQLLSFCKETA